MEDSMQITCNSCSTEMPDTLSACPNCGGLEKTVNLKFSDTVKVMDMLETKENEGTGRRKTKVHSKHGYEKSHNGEFVHKEWVLNRRNNTYHEKITNPQGIVTREISEKLTDHINRGSAKPKNHNMATSMDQYQHWYSVLENAGFVRIGEKIGNIDYQHPDKKKFKIYFDWMTFKVVNGSTIVFSTISLDLKTLEEIIFAIKWPKSGTDIVKLERQKKKKPIKFD